MKNSGIILLNDKLNNYKSKKLNKLELSNFVKKILMKKYFPKEYLRCCIPMEGTKAYLELDFKIKNTITQPDKVAWAVATEQYFFTSDKYYIYNSLTKFIIINKQFIEAISNSEEDFINITNKINYIALKISKISIYENKVFFFQEDLNLKQYLIKNQNIKLNIVENEELKLYENI